MDGRKGLFVNVDQLAPHEPLSPELVLVFSPALRAQALAALGPPSWPRAQLRVVERPVPAPIERTFARSLGSILVTRVVQLTVIFAAVTLLTVVLAQIAQAVR